MSFWGRTGLSAYVIAYNEAACIGRCLSSLQHFTDRIVVVDAESQDATGAVAAAFPGVTVVRRTMPHSFADQRNFALDQLDTEWVLTLDADEELAAGLLSEMPTLLSGPFDAYILPRYWTIPGRPGELHLTADGDPQIRLFRRHPQLRYVAPPDGLHEHLAFRGLDLPAAEVRAPLRTKRIAYPILHHKLQKDEAELVRCTEWYLARQLPSTPFPLGPTSFVEARRTLERGTAIADYPMGLPDWPVFRRGDLDLLPARIRELADFTGRTCDEVRERLQRGNSTMDVAVQRIDPAPWRAAPSASPFQYAPLFDLTQAWLRDQEARLRWHHARRSVAGLNRVLVFGDGIGDRTLDLFLSGTRAAAYCEVAGVCAEFFRWRLARFRLDLPVWAMPEGSLPAGDWEAIVCLDALTRTRDPLSVLRALARCTSRLVGDFQPRTAPMRRAGQSGAPPDLRRVLCDLGWATHDGMVWIRPGESS